MNADRRRRRREGRIIHMYQLISGIPKHNGPHPVRTIACIANLVADSPRARPPFVYKLLTSCRPRSNGASPAPGIDGPLIWNKGLIVFGVRFDAAIVFLLYFMKDGWRRNRAFREKSLKLNKEHFNIRILGNQSALMI